jgi:hypothetical protein
MEARTDRLRLIAFCVALAAFVRPATASDEKVLNTASCQMEFNSTAPYFYHVSGLATGDTGALFFCALQRDNTTNTNGLEDLEVQTSSSASGVVDCEATSYDLNNNILVDKIVVAPSGTGKTIDFGSTVNVSVAKGHYEVSCFVPPLAVIHTIFYKEP